MGQLDRIYRVCLVPLSRFLNRIAAVTSPKTAPYLAHTKSYKIIPGSYKVTKNPLIIALVTGGWRRRPQGPK